EQKAEGRGKRRFAIIEDAEELLLPRDDGSRAKVSNLLNIGDGFLGEHLNLHLVATTNPPIRQLDAALLPLAAPSGQRLAQADGQARAASSTSRPSSISRMILLA